MVAYLRQFLMMFLVLLQIAAPMVHAHVGHSTEQNGLHLSEFEAFHIDQDKAFSMAADYHLHTPGAIVNLGSAIKQQPLPDRDSPIFYLIVTQVLDFGLTRRVAVINFSPHVLPYLPELSLSHNTSRAPPIR